MREMVILEVLKCSVRREGDTREMGQSTVRFHVTMMVVCAAVMC
jgi:hypothetical protein